MDTYCRKQERSPQYTAEQRKEVPAYARRLYRKLLSNNLERIMNDEKYFTLTNESMSTNRGFYTAAPDIMPSGAKFKHIQKYSTKILVLIAIHEKGVSKPFFSKQAQAINEITYLKQCVKSRLLSFIRSCHNREKVLLWSDLVTSHYTITTINFFEEQQISFVLKEKTLQNCPQTRPVERIWQILEKKIDAGAWETKTIDQLKDEYNNSSKKLT